MAVTYAALAAQNSPAAAVAAASASVSDFSFAVTLACAAVREASALSPLHPATTTSRMPVSAYAARAEGRSPAE